MPLSPSSGHVPSRPYLAFACLALSMSLVGSYVALSKPLVAAFPVFVLAWLRFGMGTVAMLGWLKTPKLEPPLTAASRWLIFFESFLGNFLFSICMLYGVSLTSAVSAGVIMASIPAVVALMGWLFLGERITQRVWWAMACSVLGMALLSLYNPELSTYIPREQTASISSNQAFWGNILVFAAVLCEAAYAVIGKRLTRTLGPKRIASLINLWGFVLMTPLGLYGALDFNFAAVSAGIWALLAFYALAASVGSVWLWMTGLKSVPATQAGVFTALLPISAAFTGIFILGEPISHWQLMGLCVALVGVLLATTAPEAKNNIPE